jgi:hypothetical protein
MAVHLPRNHDHFIIQSQSAFSRTGLQKGLGHGNYKAKQSSSERRKGISAEVSAIANEKYVQHAHQLKMQKAWIHWSEQTAPFDFSWKSLLYKHSPHLVKFVLHASINWVRTPDLLKIWVWTQNVPVPCVVETMYFTSYPGQLSPRPKWGKI